MLNNRLRHATLAATLLLLAACGQDELPTPDVPQPGGSTIAFTIDAEMAETRSLPENPQTEEGKGAVQHVSGVRLYLFRHGDNGKTYFAGHETVEDWDVLTIHAGTDGETVTKSYTLQTTLQPLTEYTLLGIGYEKEDTEGYANAYEEQYNNSLLSSLTADPTPGTAAEGDVTQASGAEVDLSAIVTILQDNKGKADIQHNEYFTGTVTARTDGNGLLPQGTLVEMRRRVAGLSACFELTGFVEEPKAVAIMLWKDQNKDVPTLRKIWQEPFFTDHGNTPLESDNIDNSSIEDSPQCLLWIDEIDREQSVTSARSAYALPQEAPERNSEKNYTLAVVVYNAEGAPICTKRAALGVTDKTGSHLIFATDLGTGIVDDESYYRYPIVANRFYSFGTTDNPLPVEFDPSNPFEIEVEKGWEGNPDLDFGD